MDFLSGDGEYKPIPIVWFTRAFLTQVFLQLAFFFILYAVDPIYTVAVSVIITAYVAWRTWQRGMSSAAIGWKIATFAILVFNLGFVSIAAQDRIPWSA